MSRSPFDLTGRIALVTGANTGLGQAIAIALAQAGADIVALGRRAPDETAVAVAALGRKLSWIEATLERSTPFAELLQQVEARAGVPDILVNNAGTIRRADALDFSEDDWDAVVDVNLRCAFFLAQAFARPLVAAGRPGKIINIVSMLSFQGG